MFGFGKKSKSNSKKTIEFEIVTMESALKDTPQTMTATTGAAERVEMAEREKIKKEKEEKQKLKKRKRREIRQEEKRGRARIKKEKENAKQKEQELEHERKEYEEQLALEKISQKKERERDEHEDELEKERERVQQQKEHERLERQQTEFDQKQSEQKQQRKTVKKIVGQEPSSGPFLSDKDPATKRIEANTSDIKSHEQIYAQALNAQRSEDIREMAMEELAKQESPFPVKRTFAAPDNITERSIESGTRKESIMSSELSDKEKTKKTRKPKKSFHERKTTQGTSFSNSRIKPKGKGVNKPLLFIAILIFIITAVAGVYYYFFVINIPGEEWTPITLPTSPKKDTTILDPTTEKPATSEVNVLKNASLRSLNEKTLTDDLKKLFFTLKSDSSKSVILEQGMFVRPVKNNGQKIEASSLLLSLGINNKEIQSVVTGNAWLFLVKEERNTLSAELSIIKVNLMLTLNTQLDKEEIIEIISSVEQQLPQQFFGLFIEEEKPSLPQTISFEPSFTESQVAPQTRYFNYEPGNVHQSIDWGIATYLERDYLIVSTSKNSTEKLMESLK